MLVFLFTLQGLVVIVHMSELTERVVRDSNCFREERDILREKNSRFDGECSKLWKEVGHLAEEC